MGYEPLTKYVVLGVVALQLSVAFLLRHTHPLSPWFLLCAYVIGGSANQNLFLSIHEITHNLAFKGIRANKALAVFANLPIGIPYSAAFKVGRVHFSWVTDTAITRRYLYRSTTLSIISKWEKTAWIRTFPRAWN